MGGQSGVPRLVAGAGLCNILSAGHCRPPSSSVPTSELHSEPLGAGEAPSVWEVSVVSSSQSRAGVLCKQTTWPPPSGHSTHQKWGWENNVLTAPAPILLRSGFYWLQGEGGEINMIDSGQILLGFCVNWARERILIASFKHRSMELLQTEFSRGGKRGTLLWSRLYCRIRACQGWGQQSRHN